MRYIKKYTQDEWNRFDIDIQEMLCTKYNIRLIDFQTKEEIKNQFEKQFIPLVGEAKRKSKERKIQMLKKTGHVMGEIAVGTLAMIQAFSSQPKPKRKRKRRK
jgi:hypothetical protein